MCILFVLISIVLCFYMLLIIINYNMLFLSLLSFLVIYFSCTSICFYLYVFISIQTLMYLCIFVGKKKSPFSDRLFELNCYQFFVIIITAIHYFVVYFCCLFAYFSYVYIYVLFLSLFMCICRWEEVSFYRSSFRAYWYR